MVGQVIASYTVTGKSSGSPVAGTPQSAHAIMVLSLTNDGSWRKGRSDLYVYGVGGHRNPLTKQATAREHPATSTMPLWNIGLCTKRLSDGGQQPKGGVGHEG